MDEQGHFKAMVASGQSMTLPPPQTLSFLKIKKGKKMPYDLKPVLNLFILTKNRTKTT
jgi:hypothetical protein